MKQRSLKLAVLTVATAGCMCTSAFAIEHEFHGLLRIKGDFTNFDQAGGNDASKGSLSKNNLARTFFYTEQRARLLYLARLIDDVKLVTQFEIDSRWGDTSQNNNRGQGGAMEADQVNLETKNVYMEFKVPYLPTTAKAGLQPFDDSYKGIFLSSDIAGVTTTTRLDKLTVTAGWLRGYDNKNFKGSTDLDGSGTGVPGNNGKQDGNGANMPGRYSLDLGILEAKYAASKELAVGGSYYLTYDNLSGGYNVLNTLGLNAAATFGPAAVDGFVLVQFGDNPTNNYGRAGAKVAAFAANLGGKVKAGPGTARANLLYASGDDGKGNVKAFQGVNQLGDGSATSTFSAAKMTMLIANTKYAANTDRALISTVSNNDMGVMGAFFGYDLAKDKLFGSANLGFAAAARENQTFKPKNLKNADSYANSNYLGTEVNAEVGYKISENLTASFVGGYVFLGDYFKDTAKLPDNSIKTPDNPWKTQVVLNLTF